MKVSTVILSALFSFSFITALPLPADTPSLAYLAKKDITSLVPQYIKRQDEDFPDESGPGVDIPDDEDFPDEKFKRQTGEDISSGSDDDSSGDGSSGSDDESSGSGDEGFDFLMKTRRQSGDSGGDDSWKGDGGEKHRR